MNNVRLNRLNALLIPFILVSGMACSNDEAGTGADPENMVQNRIQEDLQDGLLAIPQLIIDTTNLPATKYLADKDHSSVSFRTKHWEIVDLIGWFEDFDIIMYADSADFSDAVIFGSVDPRSIKMPNLKMAGTVQKAPYIDTAQHPFVTFQSRKMKKLNSDRYLLEGTFQMNGIEKVISFDVRFNGFAYPGEKNICGFDIKGEIDRNDFQVAGDNRLHSGKKIHDDIIHLNLSLRME